MTRSSERTGAEGGVGKVAVVALWRSTGVEHAGIADPEAALVSVLLPPLPAGGNAEDDESCLVTESDVARDLTAASVKPARKAGMLR